MTSRTVTVPFPLFRVWRNEPGVGRRVGTPTRARSVDPNLDEDKSPLRGVRSSPRQGPRRSPVVKETYQPPLYFSVDLPTPSVGPQGLPRVRKTRSGPTWDWFGSPKGQKELWRNDEVKRSFEIVKWSENMTEPGGTLILAPSPFSCPEPRSLDLRWRSRRLELELVQLICNGFSHGSHGSGQFISHLPFGVTSHSLDL